MRIQNEEQLARASAWWGARFDRHAIDCRVLFQLLKDGLDEHARVRMARCAAQDRALRTINAACADARSRGIR